MAKTKKYAALVARGNPSEEARKKLAITVQDALAEAGVEVDALILDVGPDNVVGVDYVEPVH
jgi:hypothetical protein